MLSISDVQFSQAILQLGELVSFPSISNVEDSEYKFKNLLKAADWVTNRLQELNFNVVSQRIGNSAPFILAEKVTDATRPTLLLYSHYDVQPVERSRWNSDPFIMIEKNGRLYGRGASDDKAGIVAILSALNVYKEASIDLPVNIKILFEGEEEYGSTHMGALLEQCAKNLNAQALVILDCVNLDVNTGTLTNSTRGCVNLKVKVKAYEKPVHSGMACIGPDPSMALATLLASLKDPKMVPGITEDMATMNQEEREILQKCSQSIEAYSKQVGLLPQVGMKALRGNSSLSISERIIEEPSISILNMTSGRPNGGNSIQEEASCEIGIRVLPGQDPDRIASNIRDYLNRQSENLGLPVEIVQPEGGAWAWKGDVSMPFAKKYFESMASHFSKIAAKPTGGTLPLLRQFQAKFPAMEMICVGVEDPETSAHSHNESQHVLLFRNVVNTLITFFEKAGYIKTPETV